MLTSTLVRKFVSLFPAKLNLNQVGKTEDLFAVLVFSFLMNRTMVLNLHEFNIFTLERENLDFFDYIGFVIVVTLEKNQKVGFIILLVYVINQQNPISNPKF